MADFKPSFRTVSGQVNVTITEIQTNNTVLYSNQVADIPQDTLTTIVTLPANGIKYVTQIICSGEDNGKWDVFIDSVRKFTNRTTDRTVVWVFDSPLKITAAQVLDIKVTLHGTGTIATCEAAILGYATP